MSQPSDLHLESFIVRASADAWQGNAQFAVLIDGQQIGDVQTVSASHGKGQWQDIVVSGSFADAGKVEIAFINDAWGGTPESDRNLYLDSVTFGGHTFEAEQATNGAGWNSGTEAILYSNGPLWFNVPGGRIGPTPAPSPADPISIRASADAWQGNAQFVVLVDGQQVGDVQTVSASHAKGEWQDIAVAGSFPDPGKVEIAFINDDWGGTPDHDRNLYIDSVRVDGQTFQAEHAANGAGWNNRTEAALYSNGTLGFDVPGEQSPPAPASTDSISIRASADSWHGNAQFTVLVDGQQVGGVQTVSASHGKGEWQDIAVAGSFSDPHKVEIAFVNDAWGGAPNSDRNLYIDSVTFEGNGFQAEHATNSAGWNTDSEAALYSNGRLTFDLAALRDPGRLPDVPSEPLPDVTDGLAPQRLQFEGVNLNGGEFGQFDNSPLVKGSVLGEHYIYPTTQEIDYFVSQGMDTFRLPFKAARLSGPEAADDFSALHSIVDYAESKGASVILDPHDYGYTGTGKLIGHDPGSVEEFASLWKSVAESFKDDSNVMFNLVNEPNAQTATEWLQGANAAIEAIRSTGATQKILVPGSYWSGGWNWVSSDNDEVMAGIKDPLNNYAFDLHQYLEEDYTGGPVQGLGSRALVEATDWARAHDEKLFLGEFGFQATPGGMAEGKALVDYVHANSDVWIGSTYWGAGQWWGDYVFSVEPNGLGTDTVTDKPQMNILDDYLYS